jgi:hypothetical protein
MRIANGRCGKISLMFFGLMCGTAVILGAGQIEQRWKVHDMGRPRPGVVTPGMFNTADRASVPPSDAMVLLGNGAEDLTKNFSGGKWIFDNGVYMPNGGSIDTKEEFGDCQVHVEWAEPTPATGTSQGRGNSGILFFGRYEIQVLDSYKDETYADGQCGALYGQYPPLVNVCRPPGEFQTYDIVFRAPKFDEQKHVTKVGRFTVFQNGVVVQDSVQLTGTTAHGHEPRYDYFKPEGKLQIQDHGTKVRYRQIWIRKLGPEGAVANPSGE